MNQFTINHIWFTNVTTSFCERKSNAFSRENIIAKVHSFKSFPVLATDDPILTASVFTSNNLEYKNVTSTIINI